MTPAIVKIIFLALAVNFIGDHLFQLSEINRRKRDGFFFTLMHVCMWYVPMALLAVYGIKETGKIEILNYLMLLAGLHLLCDVSCNFVLSIIPDKKPHHYYSVVAIENLFMNCLIIRIVLYLYGVV